MKKEYKKIMLYVMIVIILSETIIQFRKPIRVEAKEKTSINAKIMSGAEVEEIERLYEERLELANDFEYNRERIETIDERLREIGVEQSPKTCVSAQGKTLTNNRSEDYPVPKSTKDITWTCYRKRTNVYGTMYEILVCDGVPAGPDSDLIQNTVQVDKTKKFNISATADVIIGIGALVTSADPIASTAFSLCGIVKSIYSGIKPDDLLTNVHLSTSNSITTHLRMVSVKFDGSPDSYFGCYFMGNKSMCKTTVTTYFTYRNTQGLYFADHASYTKTYDVVSEKYDDTVSWCWTMNQYRIHGVNFEPMDWITYYKLKESVVENGREKLSFNTTISIPRKGW